MVCYNILRKDDNMDCIFCKIINNEIKYYTIYEDDLVKAFLDINPSTNGDLLIIPKKHYENILDIDSKTLYHILDVSKKLYPILKEKLACDGLTLVQNNNYGQEIKHFHLHLTPRYEKDNLKHDFNKDLLVTVEDVYQQLQD